MPLRLQFIIVAVLAVALAGGWWWYAGRDTSGPGDGGGKQTSRRQAATPVVVEAIDLAADRDTLRVIGTGKAIRSASIHPSVAGEVVAVAFKAEQRVTKGQPLLRLDDKHQRLAVRLADVAVKEAERQVKRLERLARSGHASQARHETALSELEGATLRRDQARADLQDRTVSAPFDGVVGMTELDRGDRVSEETLVATLDDRSSLLVEFTVPEDYAARLRVGDTVSVKPWSSPDQAIEGTVTATGSRIDKAMRSLKVQARIPNQEDAIRPGSSFEVRLDFIGRAYPSVPEVSVLWSRDGAYLWRVAGDKVEKVFVKLVRRDGGRVLVDGPLGAGDLIVVEGVQGLRLGQAVKAAMVGTDGAGRPGAAKDG
ncbi:MAG: efflux RND transporter periplasmic adaptor subunit [Alphaproteobacteria bacterium]|jgi:RND family efflux transporter MFP subunit|nr:efflux RND transporter periplasmic adaptor subunit [Alphaproteobacteria bacterium]